MIVGCGGSSSHPVPPPPPGPITDTDILNFALNLEYLEAEFYLRATTGNGLSAADIGASPGAVTGGTKVTFPTLDLEEYANEIAQDEVNHVKFLRKTLGSAAVDRPAIDLTAFAALATAAGITGAAPFNPFADENSFLVGAFVFEDVGVTAYNGAAPLLTSKPFLTAAAGILAVEGYHAAEIRTLIYESSIATPPNPIFLADANKISALRATLGGGNEIKISATTIAPLSSGSSLAFARTTDQVLHIVYASGAGVGSKGGFFPNGLNGKIKATAA